MLEPAAVQLLLIVILLVPISLITDPAGMFVPLTPLPTNKSVVPPDDIVITGELLTVVIVLVTV